MFSVKNMIKFCTIDIQCLKCYGARNIKARVAANVPVRPMILTINVERTSTGFFFLIFDKSGFSCFSYFASNEVLNNVFR